MLADVLIIMSRHLDRAPPFSLNQAAESAHAHDHNAGDDPHRLHDASGATASRSRPGADLRAADIAAARAVRG